MYTVLIVDDEPLVRRGVAKMIDWDSLGFTSVFQAEDGIEALEVCRNQKVDLVLTDIVMPFMDGLELSAALGQEFPEIQVVILTGHEDFEYAKQSIDLGVKNYILKPIGANTLYEKMQGICKKLRMQTEHKQYIAKMKSQLHQSMPALQEKFLYLLVCTENNVEMDIAARLDALEISLTGNMYIVGIVELDLSEVKNSDIELYIFTAKNVIAECVGEKHSVFDDNNNQIVIVFNLIYFEEAGHDIVYKTMQVIQKAIYMTLRINNTCALGSTKEQAECLNLSWKEANTALDCKYSLGTNRVYDFLDLDYIEKSFYYPFEEIKRLTSSIKFMSEKEIETNVQQVCHSLLKIQSLSSANLKMVFIEILTNLLKELAAVKEVNPKLWQEGFSLYNGLEQMTSIQYMSQQLLDFSKKIAAQLHHSQKNSGELIIQKSKDYIHQHYMDENLNLSSMAEEVCVSMGYLSALFKKEAGINFTEYLTGIRIERAKELLRTTDKKTYEIAYETGYANPHYFSISFKKYTGSSPSEYRSQE